MIAGVAQRLGTAQWFMPPNWPSQLFLWICQETTPTASEGPNRLKRFPDKGPTAYVFDITKIYPPSKP